MSLVLIVHYLRPPPRCLHGPKTRIMMNPDESTTIYAESLEHFGNRKIALLCIGIVLPTLATSQYRLLRGLILNVYATWNLVSLPTPPPLNNVAIPSPSVSGDPADRLWWTIPEFQRLSMPRAMATHRSAMGEVQIITKTREGEELDAGVLYWTGLRLIVPPQHLPLPPLRYETGSIFR